MKNNILSKLSFVFVAIFSFIAFNGLVKADTVVNITSADELSTARYNIQNGSANQTVIWNLQSDITVTGEIALNKDGLNLTINGNNHTITYTKSGGDANAYALSFTSDQGHAANSNLSINDLNIVVGDGFRSGILIQSRSKSSIKAEVSFNNINITMAQENQPVISNKLKFTCPLVINHSTVTLKGNNSVVANEWSWSAIDMTSNPYNNSVLEIKEGTALSITDNRSVTKKTTEPVAKLSTVDANGDDVETDPDSVYIINPERANLAMKPDNGHYYLRISEVRLTIPDIKVGSAIPTTITVTATPEGVATSSSVSVACYVSNTDPGVDPDPNNDDTVTGKFEDGKYYYCIPNFDEVIDRSYIAGDFTKLYVNGEKVGFDYLDDYFNKWIKMEYTYELKGNNELSLSKGKVEEFVLTIDGDDTLFESLEIGDLTLVKDTDYKVTHGSTIITFTEAGVAKLNTLAKGEYDVKVKYTNGKTVTTKLSIDGSNNPKTGDNVLSYVIIGIISLLGISSIAVYRKKANN